MKGNLRLAVLFLFFGLIFNNICAQDKLYIAYFEAINLPKVYSNSATKLFKSYLSSNTNFSIVELPAWDSAHTVENIKKARESAELYAAKYFVVGEVNKLGEIILISISMHNTSDGSMIWQTSEKGYTITDINLIIERIAVRATPGGLTEISPEQNIPDHREIPSSEPSMKRVMTGFGLTFGTAYPFIKSDEELAPYYGLRVSFDADRMMYDIYWEAFNSENNSMSYGGIEVTYPFGTKPNLFFITGGIGFGTMSYQNTKTNYTNNGSMTYPDAIINYKESGDGTVSTLGGGYIVNRNRKVQLRLTLKGFYSFIDLVDEGRPLNQPIGCIFATTLIFN